jgi:hypothetical protein
VLADRSTRVPDSVMTRSVMSAGRFVRSACRPSRADR